MKCDARSLEDRLDVISDICIIGAGPAGTTLAQEFIGTGYKVCLLESGGYHFDSSIQKLSEGEISGDLHEPLSSTHLRQIGGTANYLILRMADKKHGYRFTPLDAIDFEKRDAIPYSGWPIKKTDLDPYYAHVQKICDIGIYDYSAECWQNQQFLLPLNKAKANSSVFMFGPTTKFFKDFPKKIELSENVTIYSNATVVELICNASGGSVNEALVKTFDGKQINFKAKYFIISSNALETPRLLLNSRRHHENGIGNQNDNVGRYYMDHYLVPSGNIYPNDPRLINNMSFYDMQNFNGTSVLGRLNLSETAMREKGLRNFTAALFPMPLNANDLLAMTSLEILKRALKCILKFNFNDFPVDIHKHLKNVLRGRKRVFRAFYERFRYGVPVMIGLAQGGWSRVKNNEKKYDHLELLSIVDQTPNPDNRITLIEDKDALGCNKIKLHYTYSEDDVDSIRQAQKIIGEAIEETGLGRYEPPSHDAVCVKNQTGLHHMMGTTRMSKDPKNGVVDEHCCVHGIENLFIAGSAVFTTGGFANPTLTNLAISVRVADRVKKLLKESVQ
jgi:choline dehydrogenase-like flavoprotein